MDVHVHDADQFRFSILLALLAIALTVGFQFVSRSIRTGSSQ